MSVPKKMTKIAQTSRDRSVFTKNEAIRMCYFRRACNAVSFWRCLPIMTTLVLHTRVLDKSVRSISYPYFIAEVSSCFTAHIYDERIIGGTWEQRQMLTCTGSPLHEKRQCTWMSLFGEGGGGAVANVCG